jgi:hypothetical protein
VMLRLLSPGRFTPKEKLLPGIRLRHAEGGPHSGYEATIAQALKSRPGFTPCAFIPAGYVTSTLPGPSPGGEGDRRATSITFTELIACASATPPGSPCRPGDGIDTQLGS